MAYFRTLGELSSYVEETDARIVDPGIPLTEYMADDGPAPSYGNQPSVRKVTSFAAEMITVIPLHLYKRTGDNDRTRITDHPLARMLRNPSGLSYDTPYRFWYRLLLDGLTADRWAAHKRYDPATDAYRLTRIPVRRFRLSADALDRISHVAIYQDGEIVRRDPRQYAIDYGYSHKGANGTSPLATLRDLLNESAEAVAYRRQVFKNAARIPGVILRDKPWPAKGDARARFIAGWKAYRQGGGREGADALLEDGMKYETVQSFKPSDVEALEGRKLTDIEVCSAYHIPPELLGIREGNYSNMDAFRQSLYAIYLKPYITAWEQAVNAAWRDELDAEDLYIEAHMESVLRGSLLEQAEFAVKSTGGPWMSRAEMRGRFNMPHLEGTDDLIVPLNVLVGGQANPTDTGTQNLKAAALTDVHADVEAALERQRRLAHTAVGAGKQLDVLGRTVRELHADLAGSCSSHDITLDAHLIDGLDTLAGALAIDLHDAKTVTDVDRAFATARTHISRYITGPLEEE